MEEEPTKACPHSWEPVPNETAAYLCTACGVYGRRFQGAITPWKDGKLHPASGWGRRRGHRPGEARAGYNEGGEKVRSAGRTPQLGETFIEPEPDKER